MWRATVRAVQVGIALALLVGAVPLSSARAEDDDTPTRPVQLLSVQTQQAPGGGQTQQAPSAGQAQAPVVPPFIYGFFRDPLWPGPGQRFLAEPCPIGLGATIVHYCPGLPPLAEPLQPLPPVLPPEIMQCDPWFQYFMTCRRPLITQ